MPEHVLVKAITGAQPTPAAPELNTRQEIHDHIESLAGPYYSPLVDGEPSAAPAAQPADSAMEVLRELADEVARVLPILIRAEDSGLWAELAAGTGIATTNALVHVLQSARALVAKETPHG